ncbi:MAG: CDP-alcohol phosphatidyltransferase family protein [Chloroflexota bacterium]
MTGTPPPARRHIPQRQSGWAVALTRALAGAGVRPNEVSVMGLVFAALAALCLALSGQAEGGARVLLLLLAAVAMPLRLLCNMIDGMLAVEAGLQGPDGLLYNEIPDRLSDVIILAAAGYAAPSLPLTPLLGWVTAVSALFTAYVRTLGVAAGAREHFAGPMAKPRRMHVMIAAALLATLEPALGLPRGTLLAAGLAVVLVGDVATIARRLRLIAADLAGR